MKPIFKITADNKDITDLINEYFISLSLTDDVGITSDTCTISINNPDGKIKTPRKGVELTVSIGFEETALIPKGIYVVDEVTAEGFPEKIKITARSANLRKSLRSPKTKSWHNVTLGDIVKSIASKNGMSAKITPELEPEYIEHIDQTEESDIHFLTRLAADRDTAVKPHGHTMLFLRESKSESASGKNLPAIYINKKDIESYSCTLADREPCSAVIASYYDKQEAKLVDVTAGSGEPVYRIRNQFSTKEEAEKYAVSKLKSLSRKKGELSLSFEGNPEVAAEFPINVSGMTDEINGSWTIKKASHNLSKSSYKTSVDCEPLN